jgi:hypothetical protein
LRVGRQGRAGRRREGESLYLDYKLTNATYKRFPDIGKDKTTSEIESKIYLPARFGKGT